MAPFKDSHTRLNSQRDAGYLHPDPYTEMRLSFIGIFTSCVKDNKLIQSSICDNRLCNQTFWPGILALTLSRAS